MSTQQLFLVNDSSTLANYKAWAKPISDWFRTIGYTNTADTGQLNGAGGGVGGSAGWAALAAIPGSAAYFYEVFQTNDSFTQFFVKIEYGNSASTNDPAVAITLGTGTNGSGTLTGLISTRFLCQPQAVVAASASATYECDFTGDSANSRIGAMYWRNAPGAQAQLFAIERSLNASGAYTNTYVTVWVMGNAGGNGTGSQQSILFGISVAPALLGALQTGVVNNNAGLTSVRLPINTTTASSSALNGTIPFDTAAPQIGFWDYPCTMIGVGWATDYAEGVTFTVTLYGSTRTYMPSKVAPFSRPSGSAAIFMTALRYD